MYNMMMSGKIKVQLVDLRKPGEASAKMLCTFNCSHPDRQHKKPEQVQRLFYLLVPYTFNLCKRLSGIVLKTV